MTTKERLDAIERLDELLTEAEDRLFICGELKQIEDNNNYIKEQLSLLKEAAANAN